MFEYWIGRGLSLLVDPTVVLSFDHTGYRIHSLTFDPADLDVSLKGRRMLVTGANAGIGYAAALGLAELGAEVRLLCRSRDRGEEAAARIRAATSNPNVYVDVVDLSDLASVRDTGARLAETKVDALIHNAGLLPSERTTTPQRLELTFATHVVGPHLFTRLLLPALEKSDDARIVWMSSGGMYTRKLNLEDPNWESRDYDGVLAYAETKRAQVVLSELWAAKLRRKHISVNAMHPGWAETGGVQTSLPRFHRLTKAILRTPAEGADTAVWLAASPAARGRSGEFFFDRQPRSTHLLPFTRESDEERQRLWRLCERFAKRS